MSEKNPRHLGLLPKIYNFCKKYNLSVDRADATELMRNGLRSMALSNKLDEMLEEENKQYIDTHIYFLGDFMTSGPFTPDQLKDIADIGTEVKFKKD